MNAPDDRPIGDVPPPLRSDGNQLRLPVPRAVENHPVANNRRVAAGKARLDFDAPQLPAGRRLVAVKGFGAEADQDVLSVEAGDSGRGERLAKIPFAQRLAVGLDVLEI